MIDEIWERRQQQLTDALKEAARELLAHQHIPPARISIPLGDKLWITIGPQPDEENS